MVIDLSDQQKGCLFTLSIKYWEWQCALPHVPLYRYIPLYSLEPLFKLCASYINVTKTLYESDDFLCLHLAGNKYVAHPVSVKTLFKKAGERKSLREARKLQRLVKGLISKNPSSPDEKSAAG